VIRLYLPRIYHGYTINSCHAIRVTRDADLAMPVGPRRRSADGIEESLRDRRMGTAVRLQYDVDLRPTFSRRSWTRSSSRPRISTRRAASSRSRICFSSMRGGSARLKDIPLAPQPVTAFESAPDLWSAIRGGDVLVHHPYHAFDAVTRFVHDAAVDPKVLAIKMTLYRVSPASPIAQALRLAAERGKEVAVLVELQARFDEEANIRWARALEAVGAHVVYGLVGYKTHCKACLVVREESDGIRRYCHLATGNYNVRTAGVYGDLGMFTCRESFGEDLTELFNLLTGYTHPRGFNHLIVAPTDLRDELVMRIRREAEHARAGRPARIIAKINSLVDSTLIEELYRASGAGVQID
jgi:polyphosphate kinase